MLGHLSNFIHDEIRCYRNRVRLDRRPYQRRDHHRRHVDRHQALKQAQHAEQRAPLVQRPSKGLRLGHREIYEALHPETANGATGGGHNQLRQNGEAASRFTADTAERTGRSERTIQRDAARGKALGADLNRIAGTSLDKGVEIDAGGRRR